MSSLHAKLPRPTRLMRKLARPTRLRADVTFEAPGYSAVIVTGDIALAPGNVYKIEAAGTPILTLPPGCLEGKGFRILGHSAGGWILKAGAGQIIHYDQVDSSPGGSLASTNQNDCADIFCSLADTEFTVASSTGIYNVT